MSKSRRRRMYIVNSMRAHLGNAGFEAATDSCGVTPVRTQAVIAWTVMALFCAVPAAVLAYMLVR